MIIFILILIFLYFNRALIFSKKYKDVLKEDFVKGLISEEEYLHKKDVLKIK